MFFGGKFRGETENTILAKKNEFRDLYLIRRDIFYFY